MKVYTNGLLVIIMLISLLSCSKKSQYQQATLINDKNFATTQSLVGAVLKFDDIVLRPTRIQAFDTLLFTINTKEEKLIHIFDLKAKKKIGERISVGQGPNEMIQPYFVSIDDSYVRFFDMTTSTFFEYNVGEFIVNADPIPTRKVKLSKPVFGEVRSLGSDFLASTYHSNHQFLKFNSKGEKMVDLGTYPISDIPFSDSEKVEAYRYSFTTNLADKIAVCYNWTDLIDILDEKGNLQKRIHGPKHFISSFKEFHEGKMTSARPVKGETRDAYFCPVNGDDDFYVLFSGKSESEPNYSILANQIFVFGWDGTPKQILSLDQGVFAFTVDEKNKKIYGISNQPEYHLVEFSYN